jgi:DNA-binding NarL/FixJ family response regulator
MFNLRVLIEVGFKGFVSKINLYEQLEDAIRKVSNGGYYFPRDVRLQNELI